MAASFQGWILQETGWAAQDRSCRKKVASCGERNGKIWTRAMELEAGEEGERQFGRWCLEQTGLVTSRACPGNHQAELQLTEAVPIFLTLEHLWAGVQAFPHRARGRSK